VLLLGHYRVIFTCKKYRLLSIGDKADAHARKITRCNFDEILKTTILSGEPIVSVYLWRTGDAHRSRYFRIQYLFSSRQRIDELNILILASHGLENHIHDWSRIGTSPGAVGKWVRGREAAVENADDAGWETTIPFVPFQSEIAYNVEIKRLWTARFLKSVWSRSVRAALERYSRPKMGTGYGNLPAMVGSPGSPIYDNPI